MNAHRAHNLAAWDAAVLDARRLVARAQKCRAYQFADGFDNYNTPAEMYEFVTGTAPISSSYARFAPPAGLPGQGIKFATSGAAVRKTLPSNISTAIVKCSFYVSQLPPAGPISSFLSLQNSGVDYCNFLVTAAGGIGIRSGLGSPTIIDQTGPGVLAPGWYGIEVEVILSPTAGAVTIWVNGLQVAVWTLLNLTGSSINQVEIGDISGGGLNGWYADDFRVWDTSGSTQNAPIGVSGFDSRIITKLPSGAGAATNFTPNGAAANWQCVDDNPPDGDTTYVSGATVGLTDAYAMPSAGLTAAPLMVVARSYVRRDDAGPRQLAVGVSSSGFTGLGSAINLGSSYAFIDGCIALDPDTSSAWTAAGADAAQHFKEEIA
jgi:hypothetical protein